MNSIFVHISPEQLPFSDKLNKSNFTYGSVPDFAQLSLNQCQKFLGKTPIMLTNDIINSEFKNEITEFFELCEANFSNFSRDPFWLTTLLRLYVVFLYCEKNNINKFVHLEYDNLIYSDFNNFKSLDPSLYFTQVGPFCSSAGFMYCNSIQHYEWFIIKLKQLIQKGQSTVRQFTQYDHLSEMIMIDLIHTHTKNVIEYLPILPIKPGNEYFDDLEMVYDCASYGQYLGGTNNGDSPGWTGRHHYIGAAIQDKKIQVYFDGIPYIIYNEKKIPIGNLHIHNKKLQQFI